jgi:hypothetical protein
MRNNTFRVTRRRNSWFVNKLADRNSRFCDVLCWGIWVLLAYLAYIIKF